MKNPAVKILPAVIALAVTIPLAGCSGGRDEPIASASGKVTFVGHPVPAGSYLKLEHQSKGVGTSLMIGEGGQYTLPESAQFPTGTYAVAVTPPSETDAVSEEEYDRMMSGAAPQAKTTDFPVPEPFRSTATSGKTIELQEGENTIDINFGS